MLEKIKKLKITKSQLKDIGIRTLKTAISAALASLIGTVSVIVITDLNELQVLLYNALLTAAIAAGTAVMNVAINLWNNIKDDGELSEEEINESFGGVNNG